MRLDSAKVRDLIDRLGYDLGRVSNLTGELAPETEDAMSVFTEVSALMDVLDTGGDLTERQATMLATVLGVGLSELLLPGDDRKLVWVGEQLAAMQVQLERIAAALVQPRRESGL